MLFYVLACRLFAYQNSVLMKNSVFRLSELIEHSIRCQMKPVAHSSSFLKAHIRLPAELMISPWISFTIDPLFHYIIMFLYLFCFQIVMNFVRVVKGFIAHREDFLEDHRIGEEEWFRHFISFSKVFCRIIFTFIELYNKAFQLVIKHF